ncbi:carboxypeptidase-like regulatory domain-containing protein [Bacteroidia bacterium]|nr:carboxypeptidase-like regulatory domain-containing protein [Bacteroidia bacterium]
MKIKIEKPCNENWNEMTPDEKGRFCNNCAKSVIDFSILSDQEAIAVLSSSKGELCGRVTSTQLSTPFIHFPEPKQSRIPYSKIAANLFFVASAFSAQSYNAQNDKPKTTIHASKIDDKELIVGDICVEEIDTVNDIAQNSAIEGTILSPSSKPIYNAKVEFITLYKVYTTFTDSMGLFTLNIPQDATKTKNVIRTSFQEIKRSAPKKANTAVEELNIYDQYFITQAYILTKEELAEPHAIIAQPKLMIKGEISHYTDSVANPIVLQNGIAVDYQEFGKARKGEKSSCHLANKDYYYFEGEQAIALYGEKAESGLYLFF